MTAPKFVLVPVEPTEEMKLRGGMALRAAANISREFAASSCYQHMLEASPTAASAEGETKFPIESQAMRAAGELAARNLKWPKTTPAQSAARIAELLALVAELADDLEAEIEGHYQGVKDHPAMTPKYERDMEPVVRARAALAIPSTDRGG